MSASSKASGRSATALGAAALALGVVPADATVVDRGSFAASELGVAEELCGIAVVRDSTFSGTFRVRLDKASDGQAFFQRLNLQFRDTFTNPLNDRSLSFEGKSLTNEVTATHLTGDIYAFTTIEAGQPFVVRDGDGDVVLRDRGVIRHRVVFDTLGDGAPGGTALDDEVIGVGGPHPGFDLSEEAFCDLVESLIG